MRGHVDPSVVLGLFSSTNRSDIRTYHDRALAGAAAERRAFAFEHVVLPGTMSETSERFGTSGFVSSEAFDWWDKIAGRYPIRDAHMRDGPRRASGVYRRSDVDRPDSARHAYNTGRGYHQFFHVEGMDDEQRWSQRVSGFVGRGSGRDSVHVRSQSRVR